MKTNLYVSQGGYVSPSQIHYAPTACGSVMYPEGWPCSLDEQRNAGTCFHTSCGVRAGYLSPITEFNNAFREELHYNWLRFDNHIPKVRQVKAYLYWCLKQQWLESGKFDYLLAAHGGIAASAENFKRD